LISCFGWSLPNPESRDGRRLDMREVLSAQFEISDIGGTRRADEIQHQTPKLVVHVFTMCTGFQM
jgi:hypothetical protein